MELLRSVELTADMVLDLPRLKKPKGNPGGRKKSIVYRDCICAFDIETTTYRPDPEADPVNFMYIWQFQLGNKTFYGRTWNELRLFVSKLEDWLNGDMLVCYVHNLSYEWQYIKSVWQFRSEDVFATDTRRVIKCLVNNTLEMRCSYILTNMGLAAFCQKMNVEHQKLSGEEFDYNKIRFPWTKLNDRELLYCVNDVRGLVEAVQAQMSRDGDTLYTIPLTSTGYPRREMKAAMKHFSREALKEMQPDLAQYQLLRDCFRGGNTHANRYYAGRIVDASQLGARILSADRSSSYPDVLMNCPYPMHKWKRGECSAENLRNLIRNDYAVMFRCTFSDLRLKSEIWPVPYLTEDKGSAEMAEVDNGRILSAVKYTTALTDIDFRIVLSEYVFSDLRISELYFTEYGYLPGPMRAVISAYYKSKTELKGNTEPFQILLYDKSKNILNGLYGMCAQDPVKQDLIWNGSTFEEAQEDPAELLKKKTRNTFLNYAWGVWCTAWARLRLEEGILIAGAEDFIYCDTDSVKYVDHGQSWDEYNEKRKAASIQSGAYADDSNYETHYMGVYESDGEYKRFATLGAKRYAYDDMMGDLHITISGVSKKAAKELGCLENFHDGFIFYRPGKTESDYVDFPLSDQLIVDNKIIEITSYVVISETTYNLSLTESYKNLIRLIEDRT